MARHLYSALLYLLSPLLVLYLAFRAFKSPSYRCRWGERFGLTSLTQSDVLIHSVSMGETLAALPLIQQIQRTHPNLTITVTTTSPTGSAEVIKALGNSVQHCYLPFDLPICIKRFLKQLQPKCIIIMETELWPNLIYQASRSGACLMLANARLSEKSAKQYSKRLGLFQPMLQRLDIIAAQSDSSAARFIALGVDPSKVKVCGSLKFDLTISSEIKVQARVLRGQLRESSRAKPSAVWVAGSIHPGEFDAILATHKLLLAHRPDTLLIMVPRHPEQFEAAAKAIVQAELNMSRRSLQDEVSGQTQVLLGDTMGEMLLFYGAADQAFVGGSLIVHGGHNPLEPAALGLPVFVGPHFRDFVEITGLLADAGALKVIESAAELAARLMDNFDNESARLVASEAGLKVVAANRGALEHQFTLVDKLLGSIKPPFN